MMTEIQEEFAKKWLNKFLKPKEIVYEWLPDKLYVVTAALLDYDISWSPDPHIVALRAIDYNFENKHWFTFHLNTEQLNKFLDSLEIIHE